MNLRRDPKSPNWQVEWRDHRGKVHRWAGYKSKTLTERLGRRLEDLVACRQAGAQPSDDLRAWLADLPPRRRAKLLSAGLGEAIAAPLDEHRRAYVDWLKSQEYHPRHIADLDNRLQRLLEGLNVTDFQRLDPVAVEAWLKGKRDAGLAVASSNHYVKSVKSFGNWLLRTGRIGRNPVQFLRPLNEAVAPKRPRRAFTDDELARLLEATKAGPKRWRLDGPTRYWAYRLASELGLLSGETRQLRVTDFSLSNTTPTVTLHAQYIPKRLITYTVPISRGSSVELRAWLQGRRPEERPWPLPRDTARLIRADLEAAGVPAVTPDGHLDFYSLRHTAITRLARTSASFSTVQWLARHTNPTTTARYVHARLADARAAVEAASVNQRLTPPPAKKAGRTKRRIAQKGRKPA